MLIHADRSGAQTEGFVDRVERDSHGYLNGVHIDHDRDTINLPTSTEYYL